MATEKGFLSIPALIIITIVIAVGGGGAYVAKNKIDDVNKELEEIENVESVVSEDDSEQSEAEENTPQNEVEDKFDLTPRIIPISEDAYKAEDSDDDFKSKSTAVETETAKPPKKEQQTVVPVEEEPTPVAEQIETVAPDVIEELDSPEDTVENVVEPAYDPPTVDFSASDIIIRKSDNLTLTWSSLNADSCRSKGFFAGGDTEGEFSFSPSVSSEYTIICTGKGGEVEKSVYTEVGSLAAPSVVLFASSENINEDEETVLTWDSVNTTSCSSQEFSASSVSGALTVYPEETIRYWIECTNTDTGASNKTSVIVVVNKDVNEGPPDTMPPVLSNGAPTTTFPSLTESVTLSLDTDEDAECRYDLETGQAFSNMEKFSQTGGTYHSGTVAGLVDLSTNKYYVRCEDEEENQNNVDYVITFFIEGPN